MDGRSLPDDPPAESIPDYSIIQTTCSRKSLKYIYRHLDDLLEEAWRQWNSWSDQDLVEVVVCRVVPVIDIKPWNGPIPRM